MKSFEVFGDANSLVIVGKSPEVTGWAILLNFEMRYLPFLPGPDGMLAPTHVQLLTYASTSSGIPVEMVEPLICTWMTLCIQANNGLSFGIAQSWGEICAMEKNCDAPGNLNQVETVERGGLTLLKMDVDHWKAWQLEHQVEFIIDEGEA